MRQAYTVGEKAGEQHTKADTEIKPREKGRVGGTSPLWGYKVIDHRLKSRKNHTTAQPNQASC